MPKENKHFGPPPIDKVWLNEQFNKLHSEHALILKRIEDLSHVVPKYVIPQVATAIRNLIVQTKIVDDKVPDKTVPPIP